MILDNETEIILGEHEILVNISSISLNKSLCPYPDSLTPTDGLSVANWSGAGSAMIVYDDPESRMVYYGFSIDSITDGETMEKLVLNSVEWVLPMEGDVNGDGHVTIADSVLLQGYLSDPVAYPLNVSPLISANTYEIAPGPTTINIYDVMYIQKWLLDPSTPLWDEEHDQGVTVPPQS